jgi:hypothetical protein
MPEKHAKNSPSAAHRWLIGTCSGSTTLSQIVASTESPYAARGTRAHALIEYCLIKGIWTASGTPRKVRKDLDEEDLDAVQFFLDFVNFRRHIMGVCEIFAETKCSVELFLRDCYGTRDLVLWNRRRVTVIDYKHGSGVYVHIKDNPQLMIYLLGTLLELREEVDGDTIWEIGIIQPRCNHTGPKIRFQQVTLEDLHKFSMKLIEYGETFDPFRFVPGEHCHWCAGSTVCPALIQKSIEAMHTAKVEGADPNDLGVIEWVLANKEPLQSFIKDVEDRALYIRRRGGNIAGYKLVRATKRAKWIHDNDKMVRILKDEAGDGFEQCIETKPKAIGKVREILGEDFIFENTETPEGDTVLAPVSDKRKEVGAFADFMD